MAFRSAGNRSPQELRERQRARAKRAALKTLGKVRAAAEAGDAGLSPWENEFLESVEGRVETYGRAFGDPEKGAPGACLSNRQNGKLKEIAAKTAGKKRRRV